METFDDIWNEINSADEEDRTRIKERVAERLLEDNDVFYLLSQELKYGRYGYRKVTQKKMQKAGVDYILYSENKEVYVDLKTCIGECYAFTEADLEPNVETIKQSENKNNEKKYIGAIGGVVELYQYDFFTNTKDKMTDYMLYVVFDRISGLSVWYVDYDTIRRISLENMYRFEQTKPGCWDRKRGGKNQDNAIYRINTSFNGTGQYIKIPLEKYGTRLI